MANNFCRYLSNGYRFQSNGTNLVYQPCCWFQRSIDILDHAKFNAEKEKISEISGWTPDCACCKQIEDSGVYGERSPRLRSFDVIPDKTTPDNIPVWIELTIDTTCNAACIICGPHHSTTWEKQHIVHGVKNRHDFPDRTNPSLWLEKIQALVSLDHVKSISFLGGEPFLSPIPLQVLTLLKEINGNLSDITVHFQTNGSVIPSYEIIEMIRECKLFKFNISLDGVGTQFEYLRYPLKWHRILKTIDYINNLKLPNIRNIILVTVSPLNVYYYDEVENWAYRTFDNVVINPNQAVGACALAKTPIKLRNTILLKFDNNHPIAKMFSNLGYDNRSCIPYVEMLDKHRGLDWMTVFPEMTEYYR